MPAERPSPVKKSPEAGKKTGMGFDVLLGPGLGGIVKMLRELTTREQVLKFVDKGVEVLTGTVGGPFAGGGGGGGKAGAGGSSPPKK